eukprot:352202-Chlamydomonas_euryale.AAC.3
MQTASGDDGGGHRDGSDGDGVKGGEGQRAGADLPATALADCHQLDVGIRSDSRAAQDACADAHTGVATCLCGTCGEPMWHNWHEALTSVPAHSWHEALTSVLGHSWHEALTSVSGHSWHEALTSVPGQADSGCADVKLYVCCMLNCQPAIS